MVDRSVRLDRVTSPPADCRSHENRPLPARTGPPTTDPNRTAHCRPEQDRPLRTSIGVRRKPRRAVTPVLEGERFNIRSAKALPMVFGRLRNVFGAPDEDDREQYRCVNCGAEFDRPHRECPECGGPFLAPIGEDGGG